MAAEGATRMRGVSNAKAKRELGWEPRYASWRQGFREDAGLAPFYAGPVPDAAHLIAFAVAATTIALVPGPGLLYVLARSLGGGRDEGLRSSAGTGIGGLVHVAAAALGLSAIIATSATAFTAVKYLGAAYLIWLGCRALLGAHREAPPLSAGAAEPAKSDALRQGV